MTGQRALTLEKTEMYVFCVLSEQAAIQRWRHLWRQVWKWWRGSCQVRGVKWEGDGRTWRCIAALWPVSQSAVLGVVVVNNEYRQMSDALNNMLIWSFCPHLGLMTSQCLVMIYTHSCDLNWWGCLCHWSYWSVIDDIDQSLMMLVSHWSLWVEESFVETLLKLQDASSERTSWQW